ncbi:hypothetical protein BASA81_009834 [Batrachochytrium salamandrivorans]|nr:hypothetical protein BASA81_009834 [Batrachochytrium salamandrivorans]
MTTTWLLAVAVLGAMSGASGQDTYDSIYSSKVLFVTDQLVSATDMQNADAICSEDAQASRFCLPGSVSAIRSNIGFDSWSYSGPLGGYLIQYMVNFVYSTTFQLQDSGSWYFESQPLANFTNFNSILQGESMAPGFISESTRRYWTGVPQSKAQQQGKNQLPLSCMQGAGADAWTSNQSLNIMSGEEYIDREQGASTGVGFSPQSALFLSNGGEARCNEMHHVLCMCRNPSPVFQRAVFGELGLLRLYFDLPTNGVGLTAVNCSEMFKFVRRGQEGPEVPQTEYSQMVCRFTSSHVLTVILPRNTLVSQWTHTIQFKGQSVPGTTILRLPWLKSLDGTVLVNLFDQPFDLEVEYDALALEEEAPEIMMPSTHSLCNKELIIQVDTIEPIEMRRPLESAQIIVQPCMEGAQGWEPYNDIGCMRELSANEIATNRYVITLPTTVYNDFYTFRIQYRNWIYSDWIFAKYRAPFSVFPSTNVVTMVSNIQPDVVFGPYRTYLSTSRIQIQPQVTFPSVLDCGINIPLLPFTRWVVLDSVNQTQKLAETSGGLFSIPGSTLLGGRAVSTANIQTCEWFDCTVTYVLEMEMYTSSIMEQAYVTYTHGLEVFAPLPQISIQATLHVEDNSITLDASKSCDQVLSQCLPGEDNGLGITEPMQCYAATTGETSNYDLIPCQGFFVEYESQPSLVDRNPLVTFVPSLIPGTYRFCLVFSRYINLIQTRDCTMTTANDCLPINCVIVQVPELGSTIPGPPTGTNQTICDNVVITLPNLPTVVSPTLGGNFNLVTTVAVMSNSTNYTVQEGVIWKVQVGNVFIPLANWVTRFPNPINRPALSIPSSMLQQGNAYVFQLSYVLACGATVSKELEFKINDVPFGGTCIRDLSSGKSLSTQFTFTTTNWVDGDLPLKYKFDFVTNNTKSTLRGFTTSNKLTTQLSSTTRLGNYVFVTAQDVLGAKSIRVDCGGELPLDAFFALGDSVATLPNVTKVLQEIKDLSLSDQLRQMANLAIAGIQTLQLTNTITVEDEIALERWRKNVVLGTINAVNRSLDLLLDDDEDADGLLQAGLQAGALWAGLSLDHNNSLSSSELKSTAELVSAVLKNAISTQDAPSELGTDLINILSHLAKQVEFQYTLHPSERRRLRQRMLSTVDCIATECQTIERVRQGLYQTIHALTQNLVPGEPAIQFQGQDMDVTVMRESRNLAGNFEFVLGNSIVALPGNVLMGSIKSTGNMSSSLDTVDIAVVRFYFNLAEAGAPGGKAQTIPEKSDNSTLNKLDNYTVGEMTSLYFISSLDSSVLIDPFDLNEPINVTMPIPGLNYDLNTTQLACGAWDGEYNAWSNAGCVITSFTSTSLTCSCTHASDYAVWQAFLKNVGGGEMGVANPIAITVVAVLLPSILALYLLALYWTAKQDSKDSYLVHRGALILLSRNTIALRLKQRKFFDLLRENAANPRKFVYDQDKAQRLQEEKDAQLAALANMNKSCLPAFIQRWVNAICYDHSLFGILYRFDPYYTRGQRATVVVCLLVGNLFTTALMFDLKVSSEEITLGFMIAVVVASAVIIAIPVKFLVRFLFRSTEAKIGSQMDRVVHIYRLAYVYKDLMPVYTTKAEQADIQMLLSCQRLFIAKNDLQRLERATNKSQSLCCFRTRKRISNSDGGGGGGEHITSIVSSFEDDQSALKQRVGGVQATSVGEFDLVLQRARDNITKAKRELRERCEQCHEQWKQVPRQNPRVEMLRKQQSTLMRLAVLLYDEVDEGMVRERRKRFQPSFVYVVWLFVWVYLIGTLAFCARWVLAYTSDHGASNGNVVVDANEVIGNWLLVSFLGLIMTLLLAEPLFEFLRFALVPACLRRFGTKGAPVRFTKHGLHVVTPVNDADMSKADKNDEFAKNQRSKKQGESQVQYVGDAAFDFVAEVVEAVI